MQSDDYSRDPNPPSFVSASYFQRSLAPASSWKPSSPGSSEPHRQSMTTGSPFQLPQSSSPLPSPDSITELHPFDSAKEFSSYAFPLAVHVQLPPSAREHWASGRGRTFSSPLRRPGASTSPARPATTSALTRHYERSTDVMPSRAVNRHPGEPCSHHRELSRRASPPVGSRVRSTPLTHQPRSDPAVVTQTTSESERPRIGDLTHISRPTMRILVDGDNMASELRFIRQRRQDREKEVAKAVQEIRAEKKKAKKKEISPNLSLGISKVASRDDDPDAGSSFASTSDSPAPALYTAP